MKDESYGRKTRIKCENASGARRRRMPPECIRLRTSASGLEARERRKGVRTLFAGAFFGRFFGGTLFFEDFGTFAAFVVRGRRGERQNRLLFDPGRNREAVRPHGHFFVLFVFVDGNRIGFRFGFHKEKDRIRIHLGRDGTVAKSAGHRHFAFDFKARGRSSAALAQALGEPPDFTRRIGEKGRKLRHVRHGNRARQGLTTAGEFKNVDRLHGDVLDSLKQEELHELYREEGQEEGLPRFSRESARFGRTRYNDGIMTQPTLILASSSRYRRELLNRLGLDYITESPDIDESSLPGETPKDTALRLSEMKARAVQANHPGAVVIGSDQVADLNGVKLGKPHTFERAVEQLEAMQGNTVIFYTALCVLDAEGKAEKLVSATTVKLRPLTRRTIEAYVEREKPFDCAGAAKIEKLGIALMESVSSDDPTSLIGLPLMKLTTLLAHAGIEAIDGLGETC